MFVHYLNAGFPRKSAEGVRFSKAGVTDSCESWYGWWECDSRSSAWAVSAPNHSISSALQKILWHYINFMKSSFIAHVPFLMESALSRERPLEPIWKWLALGNSLFVCQKPTDFCQVGRTNISIVMNYFLLKQCFLGAWVSFRGDGSWTVGMGVTPDEERELIPAFFVLSSLFKIPGPISLAMPCRAAWK